MRLDQLAERLEAVLDGPGDVEISGVAGMEDAGAGQITFVEGSRLAQLNGIRASAVVVPLKAPKPDLPALRVRNPRLAFARAIRLFLERPEPPCGIHERAVVGRNVRIGKDVSIHACSVVEDDVVLGDRVTLHPGVSVGRGTVIGDDSVIHANVNIREHVRIGRRVIIHAGAVVGSDGFGYVTDGGKHHKIPQVGGVIIGDDVEIGANSTIDRATLGNTEIKAGTKIDNLVHVAHNVTIGEDCLLVAQVGIAGSCIIGNQVVLAGRVGMADHVTVGDRAVVSAGSGVIKDVPAGQVMGGYYALPQREWLKFQAIVPKLPELKRQVADQARQLQLLQRRLGQATQEVPAIGARGEENASTEHLLQ